MIVHTDQGFHYQHVSWRNQLDQLDQYITWYNNNRIQERLKGLTPIEYRNQALVV
ncbi:IS3 family transposase [Arcanobacterium phocae]|uniref:IS3 family transposase n=1 Tax=Arcanobacterium phocae TaxID=131112 RepID=UPI0018D417FE|nr:IS3 family transposase [Arcanobacterium phocae]